MVVVDPSPDALAALDRRAREHDVAVTGRQGDLSTLLDVVGPDGADVVLCHGVLEVVDDPAAALRRWRRWCAPAGRSASWSPSATPPWSPGPWPATSSRRSRCSTRRPAPDRTLRAGPAAASPTTSSSRWSSGAGFAVDTVHGIRVFTDLVPGSLLDLEPGATTALVELEQAVAARPEYLPLATQLHLLARLS